MRRVAVSNSLAMSLETWRQREPSQVNHLQWKRIFHQPSMRTSEASMIIFANIPPIARCGGAHSTGRL